MSTDLKYLALTAILTALLWVPYVVCQVMTNGGLKPPNYVDPAPRPVAAAHHHGKRHHATIVVRMAHPPHQSGAYGTSAPRR